MTRRLRLHAERRLPASGRRLARVLRMPVAAIAFFGGCRTGEPPKPVAAAEGPVLRVEVEVVDNFDPTPTRAPRCPAVGGKPVSACARMKVRLTNEGPASSAPGWAVYFSSIRKVLEPGGSAELAVTRVEGDLHKIEPTARFGGFAAGEVKEVPFFVEHWMLSTSDVMPRFYLVKSGGQPAVIANTDTEDPRAFVRPFTRPEQVRRSASERNVVATAETRFSDNAAIADRGPGAVAAEILPTPRNVQRAPGDGALDLSAGVTLSTSGLAADTIEAARARLTLLGVASRPSGGVPVRVSVDPTHPAFRQGRTEAYRLAVDATGVTIVGGDPAGAFYGLQSLAGLLPGPIPHLVVPHDSPRYPHRGLQLDIARNFHPLESILAVVDQMAAYKLNVLHLHLTDDEGWRLEIPGLPELTAVGGRRCHDLEETTCLLPQLGSGPGADREGGGSGYLRREQMVALLGAARARHIEVVPEIDSPGHARAAIKAMEARARAGDATYRLSDPQDTSKYLSVQNYDDNAINACLESSYAFMAKVMDELKAMYAEAGTPLRTWHVGADEVGAGAWAGSPACQKLYGTTPGLRAVDDVHAHFIRRVNQLAKERGLGLRGWSDGLRKTVTAAATGAGGATIGEGGLAVTGTKTILDPVADLGGNAVSVNWWGTLFWWDNAAHQMANAGYQVILSSPDFLYLDHPYEADPDERGYYWGTRATSVRKLFAFISGNLPANAQLARDQMGNDYAKLFARTPASPRPVEPLARPRNIIGLEGSLWSETVRTRQQLEEMIFPRMLALAERAWHRARWEPADGADVAARIDRRALDADWERFANLLGHKELPKLDRARVHYRLEVPGARLVYGTLQVNLALPGLPLEYRNPGGSWTTYDAARPPTLAGTLVRARARGGRAGRAIPVGSAAPTPVAGFDQRADGASNARP